MKTLMISAIFSGLAFTACSQDIATKDVPSIIQNAVKAKYPSALTIDWEKEKDNYVADFKADSVEYEVLVDAKGNVLMVKQDIALTDLPANISNAISAEFKDFKIDDTERVEKNGTTYYQVELEKRFSEKKLVFMADGTKTDAHSYWD